MAKRKSKTKSKTEKPKWKKLRSIKGGFGGCLNCGPIHSNLPMESIIAVGFGDASLTKNGELIYAEDPNKDLKDVMTVKQAEDIASKDPDNDWRIHLIAPLSERHYQRQGDARWVLYKKGLGFA